MLQNISIVYQAMQETIELINQAILLFYILFVACAIFGFLIFALAKNKNFIYKIYRLLMPTYYMFFAMTCFCEVLLLTFKHFDISMLDMIIIFASVTILTTSIYSYKLSKNNSLHVKFKLFTCKKFILDIFIVFLILLSIKLLG